MIFMQHKFKENLEINQFEMLFLPGTATQVIPSAGAFALSKSGQTNRARYNIF